MQRAHREKPMANDTSTTAAAGLKGVTAGRSSVTIIDGEQGILAYRGYHIDELAEHSTFEEVVYLLWNGELPSRGELADFTTMLARERRRAGCRDGAGS